MAQELMDPQDGPVLRSYLGACLVLGGARSGKSAFSEHMAVQSGLSLHYVATGRAWDADMRSRIGEHQARRGPEWETHEEPLALAQKLHELDDAGCVVVIDCLTLWVTNLMMEERRMAAEFANLTEQVSQSKARLILVSNEVGLGIVPDNKMARDFRDHAGRLHQQIAAVARDVYFIAAGLPLKMKG